jgi:hypothetical protein
MRVCLSLFECVCVCVCVCVWISMSMSICLGVYGHSFIRKKKHFVERNLTYFLFHLFEKREKSTWDFFSPGLMEIWFVTV